MCAEGISRNVSKHAPKSPSAASPDRGVAAPMIVRPARAADVDRLLEIHANAFPDPRAMEARRRNFLENALGNFDDLRVVEEEGGRIVAHAFLFRLEAWFGGRGVPSGGIA